jgi:hypothetical protein
MTHVLMSEPRRSITLISITAACGISRVTNPLQHQDMHGQAQDVDVWARAWVALRSRFHHSLKRRPLRRTLGETSQGGSTRLCH